MRITLKLTRLTRQLMILSLLSTGFFIFTTSQNLFACEISDSNCSANALSLSDLTAFVENDNVEIKIAYENYYQAKNATSASIMGLLPKLNPISLGYYFTESIGNSTLGMMMMADQLLPNPSDFFRIKQTKHLATAEKYTMEVVRLNIIQDVSTSYFNILLQEAILKSLRQEEGLIISQLEKMNNAADLGSTSSIPYKRLERDLLSHQQQMFVTEAVMNRELTALNIILNRGINASTIQLAHPENDFQADLLPTDLQTALDMAIANSPEIKQYDYLRYAAFANQKATKYSFISFQGIGFGYLSELRIASSESKIVRLQREKTEIEIMNQVEFALFDLKNHSDKRANQAEIVAMSKNDLEKTAELFKYKQIKFSHWVEAQRNYLRDERTLLAADAAIRVRIVNLERVLGLHAKEVVKTTSTANNEPAPTDTNTADTNTADTNTAYTNAVDTNPADVASASSEISLSFRRDETLYKPRTTFTINTDAETLAQINAVEYTLQNAGLRPREINTRDNQFAWTLISKRKSFTLSVKITMQDGSTQSIEQTLQAD